MRGISSRENRSTASDVSAMTSFVSSLSRQADRDTTPIETAARTNRWRTFMMQLRFWDGGPNRIAFRMETCPCVGLVLGNAYTREHNVQYREAFILA